MFLSKKGFYFLKKLEGRKLKSYKDSGGIWTIGHGHTRNVKEGDIITAEEADDLLLEDVWFVETGVRDLVKVPLTQEQFDAIVSFSFNVGLDIDEDTKAEGLGDSTLLKLLNKGLYEQAAEQFLLWNKVKGKVIAGLVRRREAERRLFLYGDYGL